MKVLRAPFRIPGGIHPSYHKELTSGSPIETLPLPPTLSVSTSQHLGAPARPIVAKGDRVLAGQLIAEAVGYISASVHSPVSGTVTAVEPAITASGAWLPAIVIRPDTDRQQAEPLAVPTDPQAADPLQLLDIVKNAGIAGMGGAGFPTHVKLAPPKNKPIDTVLINGAECEPYLNADHRLMIEHAERLWSGCRVIRRILGAKTLFVVIEDNKPEAIRAMEAAMAGADDGVALVVVETAYPHGAEKQQIFAVTGRRVPTGGLPMEIGAVVENVGTAFAIAEAVYDGRPLTRRITSVTGRTVGRPSNILAPIGTSYAYLLEQCGGVSRAPAKIVSGGPMMGLAQGDLSATTTKTTSGLLLLDADDISTYSSTPCISCGRCVRGCPMRLLPNDLGFMIEAEDYESGERLGVMDCIECGCCSFQCPALRPLVQHMRRGKAHVLAKRRLERVGAAK